MKKSPFRKISNGREMAKHGARRCNLLGSDMHIISNSISDYEDGVLGIIARQLSRRA